MANFSFILEMNDDLSFAGQSPNKSTAIRCRDYGWWPKFQVSLVDSADRFIHYFNKISDILIDHHFIFIIITQFKGIVKQNVSYKQTQKQLLSGAIILQVISGEVWVREIRKWISTTDFESEINLSTGI